MIPRQPRSRAEEVKLRKDAAARKLAWPTYLGIIAPLLLFVVALAGGIIWYNSLKTTELMVAAAERQMIETAERRSRSGSGCCTIRCTRSSPSPHKCLR